MKKIIIARHGDYVYDGTDDLGLSDKGINQTKSLAYQIKEHISAGQTIVIWSSPQKRALDSAKILQKELNVDKQIRKMDMLKDLGDGFDTRAIRKEIDYFKSKSKEGVVIIVSHVITVNYLMEAAYDLPCPYCEKGEANLFKEGYAPIHFS